MAVIATCPGLALRPVRCQKPDFEQGNLDYHHQHISEHVEFFSSLLEGPGELGEAQELEMRFNAFKACCSA